MITNNYCPVKPGFHYTANARTATQKQSNYKVGQSSFTLIALFWLEIGRCRGRNWFNGSQALNCCKKHGDKMWLHITIRHWTVELKKSAHKASLWIRSNNWRERLSSLFRVKLRLHYAIYWLRFCSNSFIHILSLSNSHNNVASIQKNRDNKSHSVIVVLECHFTISEEMLCGIIFNVSRSSATHEIYLSVTWTEPVRSDCYT